MEYAWTFIWTIIILLGVGIVLVYFYQQYLITQENVLIEKSEQEEVINEYHMEYECCMSEIKDFNFLQRMIRSFESFLVMTRFGPLFFLQVVPSEEAWVVDRHGVDRVACEGINHIIPGLDKVEKHDKLSLREQESDPASQVITTKDNIKLEVDMYATFKIVKPMKAVKEVDDYKGKLEKVIENSTYTILSGKEFVNIQKNTTQILDEIKKHASVASERWGIKIMEMSFQTLSPPKELIEAEQKKIIAEKEREAAIIEANGKHKVMELQADSERVLIEKRAQATCKVIEDLKLLLKDSSDEQLIQFLTSTAYIESMKSLSESDNSKFVLYPSDVQKPMDKAMNAEYMAQAMKKNNQ